MFNIDLTLKNTPFPLSVQRKVAEDAEAVYQKLLQAMQSGSTEVVELTCESQTEKKVAVRASDISSVQMSQKTGTAAGGRPPGFFALAE
ncbi:hypothetical protein IQ230_04150 [Gloeocapsopsis crepidinum LEGE 06123]|uniref:UPF0367 protein IQ230_04150 n=1 Tax=Gloeocapsopsis crepidinum LEGE 06123 TaxID=588587 RepID=A0ABR9UMT6_9CHRO|nr:hypothetical protein [Gloeocapsopsis crepidinum]MBE9189569.1 hypothetical protein [Gloeocapsopsis crepidinum LEGE 06123]